MMNKTFLLLITLSFLASNASWAGVLRTSGHSPCVLKGAVYDDAKGEKKEGETTKKDGEKEPDCE